MILLFGMLELVVRVVLAQPKASGKGEEIVALKLLVLLIVSKIIVLRE